MPRLVISRSLVSPEAGLGVFTLDGIRKDEKIVWYVGSRISSCDLEAFTSVYILQLRGGVLLDAQNLGRNKLRRCGTVGLSLLYNLEIHSGADPNVSRYINHSSISNCTMNTVGMLVAKTHIEPGTELLYNYGRSATFRGTGPSSKTTPRSLDLSRLSLTGPVTLYLEGYPVRHDGRTIPLQRLPKPQPTLSTTPFEAVRKPTCLSGPRKKGTTDLVVLARAVNDAMQDVVLTPRHVVRSLRRVVSHTDSTLKKATSLDGGARVIIALALRDKGLVIIPYEIGWKDGNVDTTFRADLDGRYVYIGYTEATGNRIHACALHHGWWLDSMRNRSLDITPAHVPCPPGYFYVAEIWQLLQKK